MPPSAPPARFGPPRSSRGATLSLSVSSCAAPRRAREQRRVHDSVAAGPHAEPVRRPIPLQRLHGAGLPVPTDQRVPVHHGMVSDSPAAVYACSPGQYIMALGRSIPRYAPAASLASTALWEEDARTAPTLWSPPPINRRADALRVATTWPLRRPCLCACAALGARWGDRAAYRAEPTPSARP